MPCIHRFFINENNWKPIQCEIWPTFPNAEYLDLYVYDGDQYRGCVGKIKNWNMIWSSTVMLQLADDEKRQIEDYIRRLGKIRLFL
jgi:hypothetical protein